VEYRKYSKEKPLHSTYYILHTVPMPKITFIVAGKEIAVEAKPGETILQAAQAHGIPMESACGGNGFCLTCKCRIRKGRENVSPPSPREESMGVTAADERLGCQASITGDVSVEILEL
jgi:ferredoxin